ncbi:MAG: monoamine oxidase [Planctomycetota bacterium]|jgi:monoamine oxidase
MKHMNYSSITAAIRRIHRAKALSDEKGVPVKELLEQDKALRKKLVAEREEQKQRRDFMKTAGGLGLGAGMLSLSPGAFAAHSPGHAAQPNIAIIGAGAGGLRTAHRLQQYGLNSTIYEARDRVGGRMFSNPSFGSENRVVEWGGEFISTEHNAIRNLAHQLNLTLEDANKLSVGDEESYFINNQLYSEHDLLDEWVGGLYQTMKSSHQDAPWQPQYNTVHTAEHIRLDNLNAIGWLEEIGYSSSHWVHKLLLTDLIAEYGVIDDNGATGPDNSALNLLYLLAYNPHNSGGLPLAGTDERFHVVGGNDQIMHGMAAELPNGSIETERKLEAIVGPYEGPYTLVFDTGADETCDVLVLSLPMGLIRDIDIDVRISNGFIPEKNDAIAQVVTSDNGKVIMEFNGRPWDFTQNINGNEVHQSARIWSDPDKFISLWEGDAGHPSSKGILVDYNGGVASRAMDNNVIQGTADPLVVQGLLAQFENLWGGGITGMYNGNAVVSNWWDDPLAKGAFISPVVGTMTSWWGAQWAPEGNIYFSGEAYDEEGWSYMNGAIASAERVAKEIHQNY